MRIQYHREAGAIIVYDADRISHVSAAIFDPQYWEARAALVGQASGRGTTWFVEQGNEEWALRHYRRGGFAARISSDSYLWLGLEQTRAWREWKLTAQLHAQGLPVPVPIAAHVIRSGRTYRADLITVRLAGVTPLSQRLTQRALDPAMWRRLGAVLHQFHDAGVDHADLNAHNILLDTQESFWLIDFDKSRLRRAGAWSERNLARLQRSLHKLRRLSPGFFWAEADWAALRDGYDAGESGRTGRSRS